MGRNADKTMKREDKIKLLQGIKKGTVSISSIAPKVTITIIDWATYKSVSFNGQNLSEDYIKQEAEKLAPGFIINNLFLTPFYASCVLASPENELFK